MRRLLRAPVVALVLLLVVGWAYAHDDAPTSPSPSVLGTPPRHIRRDAVPSTSTSTTASTSTSTSTTTSTTVFVQEDDAAAVLARSWTWDQLADCESGSWGANKIPIAGSANWAATRAIYQGGLQFAAGTWDVYKDAGFPADAQDASRAQQIVVAEKVIARQGPRAWPTCAPRLGMIGPDLPLDDPITPSVPLAQTLP